MDAGIFVHFLLVCLIRDWSVEEVTTLVGNAALSPHSRLVDIQIPGVLHALASRAKQYSRRSVDRCSTNSLHPILLCSEIKIDSHTVEISQLVITSRKILGSLCRMQIPLDWGVSLHMHRMDLWGLWAHQLVKLPEHSTYKELDVC